ncbi:MAG: transglycosylase domain-containing protein [Agathobacter sp.]|nr:transglycosylase domain-containing protein [Agathobacter sp.]
MSYNKSSIRRKMQSADSKATKLKNKFIVSCIKVVMVFIIVVTVIVGSTGLGVAKGIIDSAPDISDIDVTPTGYSTTVLSADGQTIATLVGSGANRKYVTIDEIPLHTQHAFVAIEDSRFYEHNGIDLYGIARAAVVGIKDVLSGDDMSQGASTITQQLIKNNVLTTWTGETTFIERLQRKIQEQYLALKLEEQVQDKDWILENYLNTINLGQNTLGIQAAANRYFGKDVSELTLSESAVIAGITKMPYSYNPITNPEKNAERREKVLGDMLEQGYITKEEYDEALADNVYDRIASYNSDVETSYNSYFIDALIDDVITDLVEIKGYTETEAQKALYQGGLTIMSTQDLEIQKIVDEEANNPDNFPKDVEYSFMLNFRVKKADGDYTTYTHYTMLSYYKNKTGNTNYNINYDSEEECYEAIEKYKSEVLEEGDVIVEGTESVYITLQPQIALTVIDQYTGQVKALVGGRGEKEGDRIWNRATDTTRQPGSTFKIIGCYAAALDAGGMTLATVQDDCEFIIGEKVYRNSDDEFHGFSTIREAITDSYNITTLKTLQQIGATLGYEYATKFGFTTLTDGDRTLSLALGGLTNGVKNIELTAAYAAIANGGEYIEPSYCTQIYDHDGNIILDNSKKERHTVISEQTAWLLTDAMKDVMTSGTGKKAYFGSTMAQAGKTGTTTASRDSLFAGYTPYYTCVVWGGYDDNSKQSNGTTTYCRNIWREAMSRIHEDLPYKDFARPSGITTATVCMDSGYLPLDGICSNCMKGNATYTEYFALGTIPTATCNHHVKLDICSTSGQLASANCPNTVSKVYLYGGNPTTNDAKYMVTDDFLINSCTTHGGSNSQTQEPTSPETNAPETDTPGIEEPSAEAPNNGTN